jgi:hypothetical protein
MALNQRALGALNSFNSRGHPLPQAPSLFTVATENCCCSSGSFVVKVVESNMRYVRHIECMVSVKYNILAEISPAKREGKLVLGRLRPIAEYSVAVDLTKGLRLWTGFICLRIGCSGNLV